MSVGYKAIHETFTSRVTLDPANLKILVEYVDGPFRYLENRWIFRPVDNGCEIGFFISDRIRPAACFGLLMGIVRQPSAVRGPSRLAADTGIAGGTLAEPAGAEPYGDAIHHADSVDAEHALVQGFCDAVRGSRRPQSAYSALQRRHRLPRPVERLPER